LTFPAIFLLAFLSKYLERTENGLYETATIV
jgi:hypothetical protein